MEAGLRRNIMRSISLSVLALFAVTLAIPAHAQIDPYRPIAHNTLGIYQNAGASWGLERVGSRRATANARRSPRA